jgi:predicted GNAT family N-acyltransferase
VFVEEQGISAELEFDGLDSDAVHVVALHRDEIVGTARVRFIADNQAKVERMAISGPFRRKGIGKALVAFLIAESKTRQAKQVVLHAQHNVVPFYRSRSFEEVGPPFWEAGIKHLKMQMQL